VTHASAPSDLQQTDTYYVVAHIHYVLLADDPRTVRGHLLLVAEDDGPVSLGAAGQGALLADADRDEPGVFPMHLSGLLGMPRRIYTYSAELGVARFNQLSTIGAFLIGIATLVFFWNLLRTRWRPANAPNNPWGGATLEWAIPSPPPVYNFTVIPTVATDSRCGRPSARADDRPTRRAARADSRAGRFVVAADYGARPADHGDRGAVTADPRRPRRRGRRDRRDLSLGL